LCVNFNVEFWLIKFVNLVPA